MQSSTNKIRMPRQHEFDWKGERCGLSNVEKASHTRMSPMGDFIKNDYTNEIFDEVDGKSGHGTVTSPHQKDDNGVILMIDENPNIPIQVGSDLSNHYKKDSLIGRGKFGEVYKVTHQTSGRLAAAKEIIYRNEETKKNIWNEINIMQQLTNNEFIVQLYEVIDCCNTRPKRMILITEYLDGGDLFEQISKVDLLTEVQVIQLITQILNGVSFIHRNSIIHRDLKPENIIYRSKSNDQIKIIDFGFAVRYNIKNPPKSMVGTTIFVAPEVLKYECQSFQTDIWSVGVIAYDLLAGITPFEIPRSGDLERQLTDSEIMENIERCEYDFEDDGFIGVSDEAKSFILSILVKQPEKRMTAEQCIHHSWLKTSMKLSCATVSRSMSLQRMKNYVTLKNWGLFEQ